MKLQSLRISVELLSPAGDLRQGVGRRQRYPNWIPYDKRRELGGLGVKRCNQDACALETPEMWKESVKEVDWREQIH